MNIEFVSHAGFIIEAAQKKIFMDPWTKGKAFNEGWALLSAPAEVNYEQIDYIFVSHEHPDHFSFPTLKSIDEKYRKKIKILYQKHASLRLKEAFEKLGFAQVIELPLYRWERIEGIDFFCGSAGSMDSFLAIRYDNQTVLNLNDCVLNKRQYQYIKRQTGKIDFLFTQFSFANWVGNEKDDIGACDRKIKDIRLQREVFTPRYIIPFASFVYFCNPENARMNNWINTPEKIARLDISEIRFMYPGDRIDCRAPRFVSEMAVERYMKDLSHITIDPVFNSIAFEEVTRTIEFALKEFRKRIKWPFRKFVKAFGIYIHDLDKSILIDPRNGTWVETTSEATRYRMCSQVCWYTFKYTWGPGTLQVSGMFLDSHFKEPTSLYFFLQNLLSTDFLAAHSFSQVCRTLGFMWRKKWEIFYRFV